MIEFFEDEKVGSDVKRGIGRFSKSVLNGHMVFAKGKKTEIFLVGDELYNQFKSIDKNPYSLGLFVGSIRDGKFVPSLQLLHNIAILDESRILVNHDGEQTFLYGKNIVSRDVIWVPEDIMPGEVVIVCNEDSEPIGIAETAANGRIMKKLGKETVIRNIQDIGWYLRGGR